MPLVYLCFLHFLLAEWGRIWYLEPCVRRPFSTGGSRSLTERPPKGRAFSYDDQQTAHRRGAGEQKIYRGQRRAAMVLAVREHRDDERRDGAARRALRGQHDAE